MINYITNMIVSSYIKNELEEIFDCKIFCINDDYAVVPSEFTLLHPSKIKLIFELLFNLGLPFLIVDYNPCNSNRLYYTNYIYRFGKESKYYKDTYGCSSFNFMNLISNGYTDEELTVIKYYKIMDIV